MGICQPASVSCEKMKSVSSLVKVLGFFLHFVHWLVSIFKKLFAFIR